MPLVLDNITVSYRSVPAVHHVYARFEEGSSWAIFGPNGAGKSTLLKAMMRLLPIDTGSVQWQGVERRDLAYLPQLAEIDRTLPMAQLPSAFAHMGQRAVAGKLVLVN